MYVLMFDDATYWYSQLDNTVDSISLLYHVFICTYTYMYVICSIWKIIFHFHYFIMHKCIRMCVYECVC